MRVPPTISKIELELLLKGEPYKQGRLGHCPCPMHGKQRGDLGSSLSYWLDDNGYWGFNCFAGCTYANITDALKAKGLVKNIAGIGRFALKTKGASISAPEPQPATKPPMEPPSYVMEEGVKYNYEEEFYELRTRSGVLCSINYRFVGTLGPGDKKRTKRHRWQSWDGTDWVWKGLYKHWFGGEQLERRPKDPVLIVDGPKARKPGEILFPGHVVLSAPDGKESVTPELASVLEGREVTIWEDADASWRDTSSKVADTLTQYVLRTKIKVVIPPQELIDLGIGWDLADKLPADFPLSLQQLLEQAIPVREILLTPSFDIVRDLKSAPQMFDYLWLLAHGGTYFLLLGTQFRKTSVELNSLLGHLTRPHGLGSPSDYFINGAASQGRKLVNEVLEPGEAEIFESKLYGGLVLNAYRQSDVKPLPSTEETPSVQVFRDHIKWLWLPEDVVFFEDWLSWLLQRPEIPTLAQPLIYGKMKLGKSIIFEIVEHLVGSHNVAYISTDEATEKYTSYMSKLLVIMNEAGKGFDLRKHLHKVSGDATVRSREMYKGWQTTTLYTRSPIIANEKSSIIVSDDERRAWVMFCQQDTPHPDGKAHYDPISDLKRNPESLGELFGFYMRRDMSKFDPRMTQERTSAREELNDMNEAKLKLEWQNKLFKLFIERKEPFNVPHGQFFSVLLKGLAARNALPETNTLRVIDNEPPKNLEDRKVRASRQRLNEALDYLRNTGKYIKTRQVETNPPYYTLDGVQLGERETLVHWDHYYDPLDPAKQPRAFKTKTSAYAEVLKLNGLTYNPATNIATRIPPPVQGELDVEEVNKEADSLTNSEGTVYDC